MSLIQFNVAAKPIALFLDAVDAVLNSNTFLLPFARQGASVVSALQAFLHSPALAQELLQQDRQRDWYVFHCFDVEEMAYRPRRGLPLVLPHTQIIAQPLLGCGQVYLQDMLVCDGDKQLFFSPYQRPLSPPAAARLVADLLDCLMPNQPWQLWQIQPNFLRVRAPEQDGDGEWEDSEDWAYFEAGGSANTATVLLAQQQAYLLLSNGLP